MLYKANFPHLEALKLSSHTTDLFFLGILKLVSKKLRKNNQHRRNVNHPPSIFSATKRWHFRRSPDSETTFGFNPSDKVRGVFLLQSELHLNISMKVVVMPKSFHSCKSRHKVTVVALLIQYCKVTRETKHVEVISHQSSCTAPTCISVFQVLKNDV